MLRRCFGRATFRSASAYGAFQNTFFFLLLPICYVKSIRAKKDTAVYICTEDFSKTPQTPCITRMEIATRSWIVDRIVTKQDDAAKKYVQQPYDCHVVSNTVTRGVCI